MEHIQGQNSTVLQLVLLTLNTRNLIPVQCNHPLQELRITLSQSGQKSNFSARSIWMFFRVSILLLSHETLLGTGKSSFVF